ncbi:hypothetical protein HYH03_013499 [Edaphochlamys debaryana]|uniref:Uncharacterized protein n=1 Tax=Edaphochlamys debaryana TaxID=47281 RepID=A0A835XQM2_9CHLO|nr:hypothetical protein HYH03_013499 [Edaphochlamys debaryana]|eukprot:KAG2487919.1 hypothetical protein HYH03_013499 [Edaphochlamys debaryana]
MANSANLVALRDRALALLDGLLAYSRELLREERRYKQAVDDFKEALQHIVAYAQTYGSRNCVMRMLTVGRDAEECEALVAELRAVYERMMLAVAVDSNALLQEAAGLLREAAKVQDPGADARALVEQLGGLEVVKADPHKMALVMGKLDVAAQITLEAVTALVDSCLDTGPQHLIPQPQLQLFWSKLYPGKTEVPWFVWWEDFPARLPEAVPDIDPAVAEELAQLLAGEEARGAFQRAMELSDPETVSVKLRPERKGADAVTGRCQLPPLPQHYAGREEEAAGLAEHLRARGSLMLLAGGGMGKSCLAADVGWRLWSMGTGFASWPPWPCGGLSRRGLRERRSTPLRASFKRSTRPTSWTAGPAANELDLELYRFGSLVALLDSIVFQIAKESGLGSGYASVQDAGADEDDTSQAQAEVVGTRAVNPGDDEQWALPGNGTGPARVCGYVATFDHDRVLPPWVIV